MYTKHTQKIFIFYIETEVVDNSFRVMSRQVPSNNNCQRQAWYMSYIIQCNNIMNPQRGHPFQGLE